MPQASLSRQVRWWGGVTREVQPARQLTAGVNNFVRKGSPPRGRVSYNRSTFIVNPETDAAISGGVNCAAKQTVIRMTLFIRRHG